MPYKYFAPRMQGLIDEIEEEERKIQELQAIQQPQRPPWRRPMQQSPWWQRPGIAFIKGIEQTLGRVEEEVGPGIRAVTEPFGMMFAAPELRGGDWGAAGRAFLKGELLGSPETGGFQGLREEYRAFPWWKQGLYEAPLYAMLPTAGGAMKGLAGRAAAGGRFAKPAAIGAKVLKPIAGAEALPGKAIGKLGGKLAARQATSRIAREEKIIAKLTQQIKLAKPVRTQVAKLRHEEWVKRVAKASKILEKGKGTPEAFARSKAYLKGKLPTGEVAPLHMTKNEYVTLVQRIDNSGIRYFEKARTFDALNDLLLGKVPTEGQFVLLQKMYGKEFVKAVVGQKGKWGTIALDVLNSPRAVLASCDFSFPLRQGIFEFLRHPIAGLKGLPKMVKAARSEKYMTQLDDALRAGKHFDFGQEMGLYHAPLGTHVSPTLAMREEAYMARYVTKVPGIKQSERAFVTMGNWQRQTSWEAFCTKYANQGLTVKDYKAMAQLINYSTGRGGFGKYQQLAPILSTFVFSPRYLLSRPQFLTKLFSSSPVVRKEAWIRMLEFLGTGYGILAMLKKAGIAEVETDPRSTDFAKIKIGDTRLDIWAGFQQYARFAVQMAKAERKIASGEIKDINRHQLVGYFIRTKESPFIGFMDDLLRGSTYKGEQIEFTTESARVQAQERLMPMWVADAWDAYKEEGLMGSLIVSPGILGVGAMTYPPTRKPMTIPSYEGGGYGGGAYEGSAYR